MRPHEPSVSLDTQDLLDSLPCYALVVDESHRVHASNEWYRQEAEAHALDGTAHCFEVIHAADRPHHECPLSAAMASRRSADCRLRDSSHGSLVCEVYPLDQRSSEDEPLYLHLVKLG